MKRAVIYSRVDPKDRAVMPARKAAAEALCRENGWEFVHYTDSASGNRPPMQFATGNQLIRPQLTRLLSAIDAGGVIAVIPSTADALATTAELTRKLDEFFEQRHFSSREREEEPSTYYVLEHSE